MKGDVAQDLWAIAVAQPDIFKADHAIALDPLNIRPNLRLYAELAVRYQWIWARTWAWSHEAAETCPVVVLNDDGHYLSSLQYAL